MDDGTYGVVLRFRCCTTWNVGAIVQHCALMPGQASEARVVFRPGENRCPECGCAGVTWDDPLCVAPAVTATSTADAWGLLDDRLARERRNEACPNPYCHGGWVERGDNESGGAPAFACQTCNDAERRKEPHA